MNKILTLLTLLALTPIIHADNTLALRMYSLVDAQAADASPEIIAQLSEQFITSFNACAESATERLALHKENTRFAVEQAVYFRKKATDMLVDIAYDSFEKSLPSDMQEQCADIEKIERIALTWNYVAIALICHAEKDDYINSAQENLSIIKNLLAR